MVKKRAFIKEHKILFGLTAILIIVILTFFLIQSFLYFRFIIGNDLIIKLETKDRDIFLENGESKKIDFEMNGVANPFCSMKCSSVFLDIGKNISSKENFDIKPGEGKGKSFLINSQRYGEGQELYRFSVSCYNRKTLLCQTEEDSVTGTVLITANYKLNKGEILAKENLKENIETAMTKIIEISYNLENLNKTIEEINEVMEFYNSGGKSGIITEKTKDAERHLNRVISLWEDQNFLAVEQKIFNETDFLYGDYLELKNLTVSNLEFYNSMVDALNKTRESLDYLNTKKFNQSDVSELKLLIENFNSEILNFISEKNKENKIQIVVKVLSFNLSVFYNLSYGEEEVFYANVTPIFNLTRIDFAETEFSNYSLREPSSRCCAFNYCYACCKNCSDSNYPVLLLHGHAFSKSILADYNLNVFEKLQERFDKDEFLNAGEFGLYSRRANYGILGITNIPMTFKGSYYIDYIKQQDIYIPVQANSENIDTYAIRLASIINNLKYITGKDKITIIAHSMGGLVARRYAQIFGGENIDKLVLINVPNNGIEGSALRYCSFLGAELECRDMDKNSLFMNKLNSEPTENIKIFNIAGTGCSMDGKVGDGIVLEESAFLEGAKKNYFINGTCSGVELLHGELLDIDKYPELYRILKEILSE